MHSYPEDPLNGGNFSFSEKSIRMAFIRKVYSILMCQLAVTLAIGALFATHMPTRNYVKSHPGLWWVAFIFAIVTLLIMTCFDDARRKAPLNFIFLFLFTVAESFLVGCTVTVYKLDTVVWAVGITAVVCLGLTIFAFQTKIDFTLMGGVLFVAVLILFVFSLLFMFIPRTNTTTLIFASVGAFIFSLYIVYDTQLMIGGEHKYSISPEEYIFASLNLYIDIINLFLYILTIISSSRD
ncbi:glutamate NMDA receptor-associated protein 1 lifeguard isoform X2 [Lycorma delicatula]